MRRLIRSIAETKAGRLVAEYRRLRDKGLSRYYAADLALFYIPLPWRALMSACAGVLIAAVEIYAIPSRAAVAVAILIAGFVVIRWVVPAVGRFLNEEDY